MNKKCCTCKQEKDIVCFTKHKREKDGLRANCKDCDKNFYIKNKNKIIIRSKTYIDNLSLEDKEKLKIKRREHYWKNKEEMDSKKKIYREQNKEKYKQRRREYYLENKEKIDNNRREYFKNKYKEDIIYRLKVNIKSRMNLAINNNGKSARTEKLLGCTISELKVYIESKFKTGMSWDARSDWHIDHIIPCASFDLSKEEDQKKCFHYTNLQPLWKEENLKKSDKLDYYDQKELV